VLVTSHGYLVERAGKPGHFHAMPFLDVVLSRRAAGADALLRSLRDSLRAGHWDYVVLDDRDPLRAEVQSFYEPSRFVFEDHPQTWMVTGLDIRPDMILVPRRR
jgi:hypothetical protein